MRIRELWKLVEELSSSGGGGSPVPNIANMIGTATLTSQPGYSSETGYFEGDGASLGIRDNVPGLDIARGYFLELAYKMDDADSLVLVTMNDYPTPSGSINLDSLAGVGSASGTPFYSKIYLPPSMDIWFMNVGAGAHFGPPNIYPTK